MFNLSSNNEHIWIKVRCFKTSLITSMHCSSQRGWELKNMLPKQYQQPIITFSTICILPVKMKHSYHFGLNPFKAQKIWTRVFYRRATLTSLTRTLLMSLMRSLQRPNSSPRVPGTPDRSSSHLLWDSAVKLLYSRSIIVTFSFWTDLWFIHSWIIEKRHTRASNELRFTLFLCFTSLTYI